MTLTLDEFLRRFLLQLCSPGRPSLYETSIDIRNFCVLPLVNSLCVFLSDQFLLPTPQGHLRRTTFEFSATLTFSRLGAVLFRVSPGVLPHRAAAGFVVASGWAGYLLVRSKDHLIDPILFSVIRLTCPIAIIGSHHPVSLYSALLANIGTYALVGLAVEAVRRQLNHSN
jgi:hypothetical protein